jgi:antitoxin component YwqK of YwqJK toxin-antitoxin module
MAGLVVLALCSAANTAWAQQEEASPALIDGALASPVNTAAAASVANAEPEVIRERYPNTAIKIERTVVLDSEENYINHGAWTFYNERGEMIAHGDYQHGKRHGPWQRSFAVGEGTMFASPQFKEFERPFHSLITFVDGELHGDWTVEDAKGRKILHGAFEHGQLHGKATWFFASAKKRREATYTDGRLDGTLLEWDDKSQLLTKDTYLEGKQLRVDVQTYKGGAKSVEKSELHPVGTIVYKWMEGTATLQELPKDAVKELHGTATWWYTNGQKHLEGQYHRGVPVDRFTWWYSNGQARVQGNFGEGKPNGRWIWWHENGQKQMEGEYLAGDRSGKWSRWQPDGKIIAIELFTAGVDSGKSKISEPAEAAEAAELSAPTIPLGERPLKLRF